MAVIPSFDEEMAPFDYLEFRDKLAKTECAPSWISILPHEIFSEILKIDSSTEHFPRTAQYHGAAFAFIGKSVKA